MQGAKGVMAYCQGVLVSDFELGAIEVLFHRGKNGVREAKTLAPGHTGGQCPRPSWGPGVPDKDVLGVPAFRDGGEVLGMM